MDEVDGVLLLPCGAGKKAPDTLGEPARRGNEDSCYPVKSCNLKISCYLCRGGHEAATCVEGYKKLLPCVKQDKKLLLV
jgi:hypothetical protein